MTLPEWIQHLRDRACPPSVSTVTPSALFGIESLPVPTPDTPTWMAAWDGYATLRRAGT